MPFFKDTVEKIRNAFTWGDRVVPLTAEQLALTSSTLTNTDTRVELPADFPPLLVITDTKKVLEVLDKELREKHHTSLKEVGHINIAYPHKHPFKFPKHENNADLYARQAWYALEGATRGVTEWVLGSALTEMLHLGRSENQNSVHAMTAKQEYALYDPAQTSPPMSFGKPGNDNSKEYFLIVDSAFEQGTTIANLISFIKANGGEVLAAGIPRPDAGTLQQQDTGNIGGMRAEAALRPEFNDASRNTGRLAELALAFSQSARSDGRDWTPQQALDLFEEKMKKIGNSVFALTNGEVDRLIETVNGERYEGSASFQKILSDLDRKAAGKSVSAPSLGVPPLSAIPGVFG